MISKIKNQVSVILFAAILSISGCATRPTQQVHQVSADGSEAAHSLENGAYAVLREAATPQDARAESLRQVVLTYDRRKYSDAPPDEPLTYVAIDPTDYVPLIIEGVPEMKKDSQGKSILSVSLTRANAKKTEAFTRAHLGGRIAMVVDGEIVTLHKIRSVISGGKLQITRCTDNACEVIRAKLVR